VDANRDEEFRLFEADDVVGNVPQFAELLRRSNRNRQHESLWLAQPGSLKRGARRGAGSDAIVDDDHSPALHFGPRAIGKIPLAPAFDLGEFTIAYDFEIMLSHTAKANEILVAYNVSRASVHDCAHRQLRLEWNAALADQNQVD
jgi:hypothetical protein